MWSSSSTECNRKSLNRASSTFPRSPLSSSTNRSSLTSPPSPSHLPQTPRGMEEVWKDINLASLNDHSTRPLTANSTFGGVLFQDFLARPFTVDPPNSCMVSSASETGSLYCPPSSTPPNLVTALSLSSRPEFHLDPLNRPINRGFPSVVQPHHHPEPASTVSSLCAPLDQILASTSSLPPFGSKRFAEPHSDSSGDRRNKRMIKNRESAARSRARKQAYTNELQLKVDHLMEENARLRRRQQQLCEAAAGQQKKKSNLYRTSTAPF